MNNDTYLIDKELLETAQEACKSIKLEDCRNRAIANVFAAKIAEKYFRDIDTDTKTGLHNVAAILDDIDIADIYVQNTYIDVRIYFHDDELCVPKEHFDRNILPVAYMFIRIDEEISSATVTGFITPGSVSREIELEGYYKVDENELISFYDIEPLLTASYSDEFSTETELQIHEFLDGSIADKDAFYRDMLLSKEARKILLKAYKAKLIFNFISLHHTDNQDSESEETLLINDIEGANQDDTESELTLLADEAELLTGEEDDFSAITELEITDVENSLEETSDLTDGNTDFLDEITEYEPLDGTSDLAEIQEETETDFLGEIPEYEPLITEADLTELSDEDDSAQSFDDEFPIEPDTKISDSFLLENENVSDSSENVSDITAGYELAENYEELAQEADTATNDDYLAGMLQTEEFETDIEDTLDENIENIENIEPEKSGEYSTETTPSINDIESDEDTVISEDIAESDLIDSVDSQEVEENSSSIDDLFAQENTENTEDQIEETVMPVQKKKSGFIPVLGLLVILSALGYFAYTKYSATQLPASDNLAVEKNINTATENSDNNQQEAMPVESLDNTIKDTSVNEGTAVSIPAIENNLDASILVSNLSVNWEVPAGYITNNSAKRYFTKIGKIIQLNLKTELLLLNKPPINNKIVLELEYNKSKQLFDIKRIVVESGEKSVDNLITDTVKKVLNMNININTGSFGSIQGNPMLIIKL